MAVQGGGHGHELHPAGLARRVAHRVRQVQVGAGGAGAEVEQAGHGGMVQQPQDHVCDIAHPDEVPPLRPVRQARPVAGEQAGGLAGRDLVPLHLHDRDHAALMILVRAIDVEELEARPARRRWRPTGHRVHDAQVEGVLGPAVQVQRPQGGQQRRVVIKTLGAVAVGAGGRSVDEAHAVVGAPGPQAPGQFHVGLPCQVGVGGRRLADGAQVDDGVERRVGGEPGVQRIGPHHAGWGMAGQVAPLAVAAQPIRHGRGLAACGKGSVKVGADEAGAAGNEDHGRAL